MNAGFTFIFFFRGLSLVRNFLGEVPQDLVIPKLVNGR
jgi:hypothetical protein